MRYSTFLICEDAEVGTQTQGLPLLTALGLIGDLRPLFWAKDLIDVKGLSDGDPISTGPTDWWNANSESNNPVDATTYRFSKAAGINSPILVEEQAEIGGKPTAKFTASSSQVLFHDNAMTSLRDKWNFMHEGDSTFWMLCKSNLTGSRHPLGWSGYSNAVANGPSWGFRFDGGDLYAVLTANNSPFIRATALTSGAPYTLGEWILVVNTWDNTNKVGRIYSGSTLLKETAYVNPPEAPDTGTSTYAYPIMGRHPTSALWFYDGEFAVFGMHAKLFTYPDDWNILIPSINREYPGLEIV